LNQEVYFLPSIFSDIFNTLIIKIKIISRDNVVLNELSSADLMPLVCKDPCKISYLFVFGTCIKRSLLFPQVTTREMKVLFAVLVCGLVVLGAEALSSGAPASACEEMAPQHGPLPQPFPAPYTLTATAIDATRYQGCFTSFKSTNYGINWDFFLAM